MSERKIVLTREDYEVLKVLVERCWNTGRLDRPQLLRFMQELKTAQVMEPYAIPDNIITVNSTVGYRYLGRTDSGESCEVQIVFPADVGDASDRVSILSPLGLALIGERQGTEIEYVAPGGSYQILIETVEQRRYAELPAAKVQ